MKIALDVLGGDSAPESNIQGAIDYLNSCGNAAANLILVGDKKQIESSLRSYNYITSKIEVLRVSQSLSIQKEE